MTMRNWMLSGAATLALTAAMPAAAQTGQVIP